MNKTEKIEKIVADLDLAVITEPTAEDFELDVKRELCREFSWAYEAVIEKHGVTIPETEHFNLDEVAADWIDDEWETLLDAADKRAAWDKILSDMRQATEENEDWTQYAVNED